jgi:hypothetical protein
MVVTTTPDGGTDMKQQRRSGAGFWFGLMLGIAIGVALAVLFLPRPGGAAGAERDTGGFDLRQRAQERFGPLIERLRERYGEALALGQDFYERAKDDVTAQYSSAKSGDFSSNS